MIVDKNSSGMVNIAKRILYVNDLTRIYIANERLVGEPTDLCGNLGDYISSGSAKIGNVAI